MKSIETEYNGILFRSRLEARWAILFDALELKYVYEPECFILSNGQKYTPDFYIEKFKLYIEVKPNFEWMENEYHAKRYSLFEENLLILSDSYPCFSTNLLYEFHDGKKYKNNVIFCPNHKYAPFFYTGCNLGEQDELFVEEYREEILKVKQYRFY